MIMNKDLLRKYFQNEDFHPITIVVGAKRITLENDINIDYQNEVIIYPMPQTTRIIPFTSITYIDLKDTKNTHINLYKLEQGPQQKGMRQAFQQTMQVGVGPTETVWHIIIFQAMNDIYWQQLTGLKIRLYQAFFIHFSAVLYVKCK